MHINIVSEKGQWLYEGKVIPSDLLERKVKLVDVKWIFYYIGGSIKWTYME